VSPGAPARPAPEGGGDRASPPGGAPAGLSSTEAAARLSRVGPNDPGAKGGRSLALELLVLFANPLVIILLVASAVSAVVGERVEALLIALMVVLSVVVNFAQTYRSRVAADRLRASVAPTATALRDGGWREIPRREVVPGDVVRLSAGDLVPADARLIESRDLHVQQAALTGESLPVEKEAGQGGAGDAGPDAPGLVFLGTSVVSGIATAEVLATGASTRLGDIAARLVTRPPETEFERGLRQFGVLIMSTVVFLVLFILVVSLSLHRHPLESLLFAVALAVGLTPEFLPMITTVTLAKGELRMSRAKVVVKHLAAIQNLGSMDVLCCDKTGTLTAGEMRLDRALGPLGEPSERPLLLATLNSRFETGIRSPLDAAILERRLPAEGWEKRDEIPFDFERRRLSVVVEKQGDRLLVTKGAPEGILALCTSVEVEGHTRPADAALLERCADLQRRLGGEGLRLLAVAHRRLEERPAYTAADERDLTFAGFLAFSDPPLPETPSALQDLRRDGVAVKIVSGDDELVTRHVCVQVGLDPGEIVLGRDLERMGDTALQHVAETATVFARVSPAQKNRILLALKRRGHVVGFLGDGINDAPSLHAADVGISVHSAVDVARDAAEIILLDRGLRVLHTGVREGRKAFGNVMKYLLMGTSSNFGNMFSMAGASLFLPFLPMLPTQILLTNFLYDLAQVTLPTDNVDAAYLRRPRRWDMRVVRNFMLLIGPVSSLYDFLTFFVLIRFFHASEALFHTGWFVESLATQTLVVFVIRTVGNPLRSRPSPALAATVVGVVLVGALLPLTPLAGPLGFTPLPLAYVAFVAAASATYLVLVQLVKSRVMRRLVEPFHPAGARA
jgi:Mg2+-importing ATPase